MESVNPATGSFNCKFGLCSQEDIDRKIERSRSEFDEWKNKRASERVFSIRSLEALLREKNQELAELITKEMGKPITESIAEIEKCAWLCDYFASNAEIFIASEFVETDAETSGFVYEPAGVILSITPWNYPFWEAFRFAIPAIAGGNTVITKSAGNVPMCALEIENLFIEAGFPDGVYQALHVDGPTASSLISRCEINGVAFTGSIPVGQKVSEAAGKYMKKFVLELGGSDPFIVMKDADIERAAKAAVPARFQNCGQSCLSSKRFLIDESVADEFTEFFIRYTNELKIGDPMDPKTDLGPMVNQEQRDILEDQVKRTLKMGANVLVEGGAKEGDVFYYMPTVLNDINKDAPVLKEETLGPVAPIVTFKDEDEAIKIANNTDFGLGCCIWNRETEKAMRMARRIHVGFFTVNNIMSSDPRLPFGGMKKSGVGRELHRIGMLEFMNAKSMKVYEG